MGLSINREKVIKGLKLHGDSKADCDECPYRNGESPGYGCLEELCKDAISLLKEQEPKLVRIDEDSVHCPSCGNELFTYPRQKFCDECGQAVKWE